MHIYFPCYYKYLSYHHCIFLIPQYIFAQKLRLYLIMSSITYLLLIFLCISLHACSARHLSTLDKELEKKPHFSLKNISEEKKALDSTPKQLNDGNDKMKIHSEKPKNRRSTNQRVLKEKGKASSGALQTESTVSVSWRVPHKKPSEKNPGFNLDYSPPKTHPPSHN